MKETADKVIAALYTAAVDPTQWGVALGALTSLADARAANCFVHDATTNDFLEYRFAGYGPNWARDYASHYHRLDLARGVLLARAAGAMYPMHRYVPDTAVERSEYYQDFYIREGLRYSCGGTLLDGNRRLILAVHRPVGHQPYGDATVGELQRVLNHLPGVFRVRDITAQTGNSSLITTAALDALPRAVLIVDCGLDIQYLNGAARSLLRSSTEVNVRANRLTLSEQRIAQQLTHQVQFACLKSSTLETAPLYVTGTLLARNRWLCCCYANRSAKSNGLAQPAAHSPCRMRKWRLSQQWSKGLRPQSTRCAEACRSVLCAVRSNPSSPKQVPAE
jgi:PAS domain-containing protein